ncbi:MULTISPECIES: carboxylating nicotinate-nucleotide diphosphorylase [Sphingomonadales]|jgi:nicotinate-nucleotide pyrophosphorylase (carboxylating)|uniref:nicotinate-nucleotide diphosphorylase (carboxylating) n=6 Tax=Sphingomonadaceae TaxID=41297 RepID=A0ABX8E4D6_9SPHN|nr:MULTISPECIES: carboxylating nicotinate-nucleotide diphosphorylase [Sphingomonadales]MAC58206.1 nicotinate-nucleotide diphosphorylase (carboxylating) [Novosphingobium sp.]MAM39091.1 nicotinate-nucleotide diphosphorylase (carboxylating) [Erythrobacter sp.]MBJ7440940.1 carboxylating nicotinate-nucleotide diphosphorylase [Sphingopyxis sp.]MBS48750.1 nicotinate-nucleotide diphosphorylase (carboxylating) [Sphingobium sp.]TNE45898.1 MAG: carboxylating nicotinate-nucleotide diphosphorylase [Sphingo|tara:strand:+ start:997 stop:1860 length:864 start_codon:yes stop_codon:yes gene_type:complete
MRESDLIAGLDQQQLDNFVDYVLSEDLGSGDVTSRVSVPASARFSAVLAARQPIVVAGLQLAAAFFGKLDPEVAIEFLVQDGDNVAAGQPLMRIAGSAQLMLAAERSALNTLQHLTGIATVTRSYAEAIAGTDCVLLDTRKTIPGLRAIEKYAAKVGGARNHRMRLDDGILIKDNHIAAAGSIVEAVKAAKAANTGLEVQVEVDGIEQIEPALMAGADRLLCDNMSPAKLKEAVALVGGRVPIEASGGVRLDTIREIASTGVDFVSVGRITQSAPAADIGLDYALSP